VSLPLRLAAAALLLPLVAAPVAHAAATASTTSPAAPVNLLTGDTAALSGGTGTWTAENGTVALGAPGVLATTTATSGWSITKSGPGTQARAGSVYTGGFKVEAATTSRQVVPYLYFYDSAGAVLDKVKGEVVQDSAAGWTAVTSVVGIAPAAATSVALVSLTWGSVMGEVHYVKEPVLTSRTAAAPSVVAPLRTVGNQVYDANGPIVLKGVNLSGFEYSPTGQNLTLEDVSQANRWGATLVRLPLSSAFWLSSNCHYSVGYAALVDSFVQEVTRRGMVVLLDLHTNNTTGCGPVTQQPMADATAVDFWRSVASRYAANPLVAFDLYNEPHDISDSVWLNGGSVTTSAGTYQAVGMQQLYNTVRATGATNLVFASGQDWASTPPARLLSGENLVYGVHAYTCPVAVDATCQANRLQPPTTLNAWVTPAASVPVVATEFGWPAAGSGTYNANVVALLKARGWGWTAFAWDGTPNGRFTLLGTAGPGASYQPSASGMPVLTALSGG
jgi:endoglucanase